MRKKDKFNLISWKKDKFGLKRKKEVKREKENRFSNFTQKLDTILITGNYPNLKKL